MQLRGLLVNEGGKKNKEVPIHIKKFNSENHPEKDIKVSRKLYQNTPNKVWSQIIQLLVCIYFFPLKSSMRK